MPLLALVGRPRLAGVLGWAGVFGWAEVIGWVGVFGWARVLDRAGVVLALFMYLEYLKSRGITYLGVDLASFARFGGAVLVCSLGQCSCFRTIVDA